MLTIIWMHFVADFLLQWDEMAKKKSSDFHWLILHSAIYSIPFLWFGLLFWAVTFFTHMIVDGVSSRVSKILYAKNSYHWFFAVIGFDQALHMTCLFLCYKYLILKGAVL